jgi:hypothetical protein
VGSMHFLCQVPPARAHGAIALQRGFGVDSNGVNANIEVINIFVKTQTMAPW